MHIYPVQQWTGYLTAIPLYLQWCAQTLLFSVHEMSAWTGVHRTDQHKPCGICNSGAGTTYCYAPILYGLSKHLQYITSVFREFIDKQDTIVCEAYLTRPWHITTTGHTHVRDRMVRRPERSSYKDMPVTIKPANQAVYLCSLYRLIKTHVRKYCWNPLCKHGLSGTRRPDHQHIMAACCCNLQSPLCILLPSYICKVLIIFRTH